MKQGRHQKKVLITLTKENTQLKTKLKKMKNILKDIIINDNIDCRNYNFRNVEYII